MAVELSLLLRGKAKSGTVILHEGDEAEIVTLLVKKEETGRVSIEAKKMPESSDIQGWVRPIDGVIYMRSRERGEYVRIEVNPRNGFPIRTEDVFLLSARGSLMTRRQGGNWGEDLAPTSEWDEWEVRGSEGLNPRRK